MLVVEPRTLWELNTTGLLVALVIRAVLLEADCFFCLGNLCMVTGGANLGRIGVITNRERHPGSFDVVHVKDASGNSFATRLSNIFVIVKGTKPWISLPRGKGIRLTIAEERDKRLAAKQSSG